MRRFLAVCAAICAPTVPVPASAQTMTGVLTQQTVGSTNLFAPTPLATFQAALSFSNTSVTANGTTIARTLAARAADTVNAADYGAVGDMTLLGLTTYTIAASSTALSATAGVFNPNVVGKTIVLPGAGANGAGLVTVITGWTDQGHVTLGTAARTALSSANETPEIGTDNTAAINAAIAAAESRISAQGPSAYVVGSMVIPDGMYLVRTVNLTGFSNSALRITGNATLWGVNAGYPVVDTLGSRWIKWTGVSILGDQYAVPSAGLQLGRTNDTGHNSSDNSSYENFLISGYFTQAAMLNEQSETTRFEHVHFYNNQGAGTYAVIMDGVHYFPVSTVASGGDNEPMNQGESFDENIFVNCIFGGYTPLWIGVTNRMNVVSGYSVSAGPYGAVLYTVPGGDNLQLHLDLHQEDVNNAMQYSFFLTGTDPTPYLEGFHWNDNGNTATTAAFKVDPTSSITSVAMPDANIDVTAFPLGATVLFADPGDWSLVSGVVHVPTAAFMNIATFQGQLSTAAGETDYSSIAAAPFQTALAYQGITANDMPAGVNVAGGGHYYVTGTAYAPTLTFSAPASGATATGHASAFSLAGVGSVGNGGKGYTVGNNVPVEDPNGVVVFYANITAVNASTGAITGLQFYAPGPAYASTTVPASLTVVQSGGAGGTLSGTNFAISGVTLDSPGSGYTSLPTVAFSSLNAAPAATGTAVPSSLNILGTATFGSLEQHSANTGIAAATIAAPKSGTAPAGATQLASTVTVVSACSTTAPLQLPAGTASGSLSMKVLNRSGNSCAVYPPSGGSIEGAGANVPTTIASGSDTNFVSLSASAWDQ